MFATYAKLLFPFAPHLAEEIWAKLGYKEPLAFAPWPTYEASDIAAAGIIVVVQVNGKKRAEIEVAAGLPESELAALAREAAAKYLEGAALKKTIVVADRLVNFVI